MATELQDDAEGSIARILTLMDGTRDIEQICADFVADSPEVERENVREIVEALISEGFIEDAEAEPPANLSARELERYARARHFYSWIDTVPRESPPTPSSRRSSRPRLVCSAWAAPDPPSRPGWWRAASAPFTWPTSATCRNPT
ncbi:hypothetical protein ACFSTC_62135 [Nonomuraea ferruginea]